VTKAGNCDGSFAEGTAPYSNRKGISAWKHPNGDIDGPILVQMGTDAGDERLGVGFECVVSAATAPTASPTSTSAASTPVSLAAP
jgi:hypothetical protein